MLTEQYFASTLRPADPPSTSHLPAKERDAGIYLQEIHPHPTQKLTFKKSSTSPNGLAISRTHVFAAQADKAVVHVYDRATGKQECLVPFPEKVTSLALLRSQGEVDGEGSNAVLALGMEGGRINLWEVSIIFSNIT
jgi:pre-rRNA-processing protein IPI3